MATAPSSVSKIECRGLRKAFGPKVVLDGLDLRIEEGESLVILGGSGTGKSVLLKHLIGLLRPDAGSVLVDGVDIGPLDDVAINEMRRKFGMAFQEGALFDSMSVGENIAFPLVRRRRKLSKKELAERVADCLETVGLAGIEAKRPSASPAA